MAVVWTWILRIKRIFANLVCFSKWESESIPYLNNKNQNESVSNLIKKKNRTGNNTYINCSPDDWTSQNSDEMGKNLQNHIWQYKRIICVASSSTGCARLLGCHLQLMPGATDTSLMACNKLPRECHLKLLLSSLCSHFKCHRLALHMHWKASSEKNV